jgi:hypothetical protein
MTGGTFQRGDEDELFMSIVMAGVLDCRAFVGLNGGLNAGWTTALLVHSMMVSRSSTMLESRDRRKQVLQMESLHSVLVN